MVDTHYETRVKAEAQLKGRPQDLNLSMVMDSNMRRLSLCPIR